MGTIVCGVGHGTEALAVAQLGAALAARLQQRLVLVHVLDGIPAEAQESVTARQREAGGERMLQELARKLGDEAELRLVLGSRSEALASVAADEGADLIVVGSRRVGFRGKSLRSTLARELESVTPVPVLVAPPATRERSDHRLGVVSELAAR